MSNKPVMLISTVFNLYFKVSSGGCMLSWATCPVLDKIITQALWLMWKYGQKEENWPAVFGAHTATAHPYTVGPSLWKWCQDADLESWYLWKVSKLLDIFIADISFFYIESILRSSDKLACVFKMLSFEHTRNLSFSFSCRAKYRNMASRDFKVHFFSTCWLHNVQYL